MPMRRDCRHYESRTYQGGEAVRKCDLDLAPEAPWRCPEGCSSFQPRLADVNWAHGALVEPPTPREPVSIGQDGSIGALLDEAEDIVNRAAPGILAELDPPDPRPFARRKRTVRRWFRRRDGG